jgi:uncharacterized membrane protein
MTSGLRRALLLSYSYGPWIVAAAFSVSGVVHISRPVTFSGIVPHFLPFSTALVYVSGVAELICAFGLWRRKRWAGYAATVLLLFIWPANLQDAIMTQESHALTAKVVTWLRLPLQLPLIWLALQSGRTRAVAYNKPNVTASTQGPQECVAASVLEHTPQVPGTTMEDWPHG